MIYVETQWGKKPGAMIAQACTHIVPHLYGYAHIYNIYHSIIQIDHK